MKELIDELRACANGHPLDIYAPILTSAADALESQAREISSKQAKIDGMNKAHWKVVQELATLKAQPSGAVLPDENSVMRLVLREMGNSTHVRGTSNWCADIGMAVVCEVARLNQPASAGDERAAFDAWFCKRHSYKPGTDTTQLSAAFEPFKAWQARAALSANHSEQVRVPEGWQLVPIEPTEAMVTAGDDVEDLYLRGTRSTWAKVYRAMLAAAPSAGSQGGDA